MKDAVHACGVAGQEFPLDDHLAIKSLEELAHDIGSLAPPTVNGSWRVGLQIPGESEADSWTAGLGDEVRWMIGALAAADPGRPGMVMQSSHARGRTGVLRVLLGNTLAVCLLLVVLAACSAGQTGEPQTATPSAAPVPTATPVAPSTAPSVAEVAVHKDLAYGSAVPGNLLDLYVPGSPADAELPLIIWHTGSAWSESGVKDFGGETAIVKEFTARGFAVASINIRSSSDARFPAQGFDVRAAIRYLRENAATYGIDPDRFAFMGDSSGGWATAFAAATSDRLELEGETSVDGTSSAVRVAVAFFPPTDFLSIDAFVAANNLQMNGDLYPINAPSSVVGLLIQCPTEGPSEGPPDMGALVSIQDCPDETEKADPASYIDEGEVPIWLLHGLADSMVPYNQSQLLYDATVAAGNEARLTLVPGANHAVPDIIEAAQATTWATDRDRQESETEGSGPSWDDLEKFIRASFE
jgi:acetyl esterase/lipase